MINLFDLSAQMAGTKILSDKSHRDVSPIRRKSDVKRDRDPSPDQNLKSNTNGTPMKTLLAKEMSKEAKESDLKRNKSNNSSNVIAKLMGLDETNIPTRQPVNSTNNLSNFEGPIRKNPTNNMSNFEGPIRKNSTNNLSDFEGPIRKNPMSRRQNYGRHSFDETIEYKDVYEVHQNQEFQDRRMFEDQRMFHRQELQNGRIYRDNERFENGRNSNWRDQLQNGRIYRDNERLQNGTMDLVREKFMEAKRLATDQRLLQSKEFEDALEILSSDQDLFLKFLEEPDSLFNSNSQAMKITLLKPLKSQENSRKNNLISNNNDRIRPVIRSESFSQPTRIVVLKPTSVKIGEKNGVLGNNLGHRRDESLISSICSNGSNGYRGDESSLCDKSCNESNGSLEEEYNDSEILSPVSYNSRDYFANNARNVSPSFSSFSRVSDSPKSSVIKEAKKRLSERWQMVMSSDQMMTSADQVVTSADDVSAVLPRCSSTLGEMLYVQDSKKENQSGQMGQTGQMGLSRSQSVPVSSSLFDDLNSNSNLGSSSSSSNNNNKGKLSFKGKVSSFFFSRSKKEKNKEKISTDFKAPGQHIDEISSNNNLDLQLDNDPKGNLSIEKANFSNEIFDKPKPSPTSVLDLPFDDLNFTESSQISKFTNQQPPLSRSSVIESISRTLSWDEKSFESPINPQIKEKESFNFVRKLISDSGFDIQMNQNILSGFHSLNSALDPSLLDNFLERKTEDAKCRERRSNQRLLFDCVNSAILQIGHSNLRNLYPWSRKQSSILNSKDDYLIKEIWRLVKEWISSERKLKVDEKENASLMVERIVHGDYQGKEWEELKWFERDELSKEIEIEVLDELVKEIFSDFV